MAKNIRQWVLLVGTVAVLGACSRQSAPTARTGSVDDGPLRAAIGRIFGGALVPDPRPEAGGGKLAFRYAGGQILVDATRSGQGLRLRLKVSGISLATLDPSGLLRGTLEGEGNLTTSRSAHAVRGDLTLRCVGCTLGGARVSPPSDATPGRAPTPFTGSSSVTIPTLSLGDSSCRLELADGRATFRQCEARSADVTAELVGSLELRDPFRDTTVQAQLRLRLAEALKAREPKWRAIESALPGAAADGTVALTLRGKLVALRVVARAVDPGQPPRGGAVPASTPPPAQPPGPLPADAILRLGAHRFAMDVPAVMAQLMGGVASRPRFTAVPLAEGGAPVGFELREVAPGSLLTRLGLQSGDVLLEINGQALTSPDRVLQVYVSTTGPGPWILTLRRGGKRLTVTYERLRSG